MRILVTGATGNLGAYLVPALVEARHDVISWNSRVVDLSANVPLDKLDLENPDVILHVAAISSAEAAWRDPATAAAVNATATQTFAAWCSLHGKRLIYTSTDLVFDGKNPWYRESSPTSPVLEYGRTKQAGELAALSTPRGLVARLTLLYGASRCGKPAYYDRAIEALRQGMPQTFFEDEFRTPLDYATTAKILVQLLETEARGVVHVAGTERVSRFDLMRRIAQALRLDHKLVRANRQADAPSNEPRPADLALHTDRLANLLPNLHRPTIEEAVSAGF